LCKLGKSLEREGERGRGRESNYQKTFINSTWEQSSLCI